MKLQLFIDSFSPTTVSHHHTHTFKKKNKKKTHVVNIHVG